MKIDRIDALCSLVPDADCYIESNEANPLGDWSTLIWHNKETCPTEAEIDAELVRMQAEYDSQEYARNRQAEFPSIQDLVVALYDTDDKADIEAKRAAVKAKYPKP